MPTDVPCDACGQTFQYEGSGPDARCPHCQATVHLPSAAKAPGSAPSAPAGDGWHVYTCDRQRFGPITKAELDRWAEEKRLTASCQVYQDGWPTWRMASEFYPNLPPAAGVTGAAAPGPTVGGAGGGFAAANVQGAARPSDNPYSAPQSAYVSPTYAATGGAIGNQPVDAGQVLNHAWKVWSANLWLLVGMFLVLLVINYAISFGLAGIEQAIIFQGGDRTTVVFIHFAGTVLSFLVQTYLGVGQAQVLLKLLRGQPATFGELFGGGPRFWPVVGVSILGFLGLFVGFLACIIPGIILLLMFWPCYYVVLDGKAGVMDSFSVASGITAGNRGTTFVLWLASLGIAIVGFLALCIGIIFAIPLVSMMWATAYLMMSAQLSTQPPPVYQTT